MSTPYRVTTVCTGNICRSPMLEFLLREALDEAGLTGSVVVDSAGTTSWEAGSPADPRTLAVLKRHGHADWGGSVHVAQQLDRGWFADRDLFLVADSGHEATLRKLARSDDDRGKVRLIRTFDPNADRTDLDDPWYGDDTDFERTYAELQGALPGLVDYLGKQVAIRSARPATR